jgi:hypothetical protein
MTRSQVLPRPDHGVQEVALAKAYRGFGVMKTGVSLFPAYSEAIPHDVQLQTGRG